VETLVALLIKWKQAKSSVFSLLTKFEKGVNRPALVTGNLPSESYLPIGKVRVDSRREDSRQSLDYCLDM
jgi:hypothetical protein